MADTSQLAGLLDRARNIFSLADKLATGGWHPNSPDFDDFCVGLWGLRDAMQNPPDGFAPVAEALLQAADIAKVIRESLQRPGGLTWADHLHFFPHLNSVALNGERAVNDVTESRLDDQFDFLNVVAANNPLGTKGESRFDALVDEVLYWRNGVLPIYWRGAYHPGDFQRRTADPLRRCLVWLDANGFQHLSARLQSTYDTALDCVADLDAKYDQHPAPADATESDSIVRDRLSPCYDKTSELVELLDDIKLTTAEVSKGEANLRNGDAGLGQGEPALVSAANLTKSATNAKRSTEQGEAQAKLIAALTEHHKYADRSCLNLVPVGNNELARLAEVSASTASGFFKKQFGGYSKYRTKCRDAGSLADAIKALRGEFTPRELSQVARDAFEARKQCPDDD